MYLIDTVVLSELRKRQRDAGLASWIEQQRTTDLFVSVITIGEIERGIGRQRARDPDFAAALAAWLDRLLADSPLRSAGSQTLGAAERRAWQ